MVQREQAPTAREVEAQLQALHIRNLEQARAAKKTDTIRIEKKARTLALAREVTALRIYSSHTEGALVLIKISAACSNVYDLLRRVRWDPVSRSAAPWSLHNLHRRFHTVTKAEEAKRRSRRYDQNRQAAERERQLKEEWTQAKLGSIEERAAKWSARKMEAARKERYIRDAQDRLWDEHEERLPVRETPAFVNASGGVSPRTQTIDSPSLPPSPRAAEARPPKPQQPQRHLLPQTPRPFGLRSVLSMSHALKQGPGGDPRLTASAAASCSAARSPDHPSNVDMDGRDWRPERHVEAGKEVISVSQLTLPLTPNAAQDAMHPQPSALSDTRANAPELGFKPFAVEPPVPPAEVHARRPQSAPMARAATAEDASGSGETRQRALLLQAIDQSRQ
ncbi:hypothetical protein CYMTET_25439, partial [Cymbomonas tetramitiformis]